MHIISVTLYIFTGSPPGREIGEKVGNFVIGREKQNTLKNLVVSGKKYFFLYRGLGLDLFSS